MDYFVYREIRTKVIFGQGQVDSLSQVVESVRLERCTVLTTPSQWHFGQRVEEVLDSKAGEVFDPATMHTPVEVTEEAIKVASKARIDSTVSVGGGSTTDLGKAIAVRLGVRQICIRTTYAGIEMTSTLGETVNDHQTTRRDKSIRPDVVIYDVDLTLTLALKTSTASGMDAMAHAEPSTMCFGSTKMGLYHKICHAIGGTLNLPHAGTCTAVLPRALSYNAQAVPQATTVIAEALPFGEGDAVKGLDMLIQALLLPTSLAVYGMGKSDIDPIVSHILLSEYENPMPLVSGKIPKLIASCFRNAAKP